MAVMGHLVGVVGTTRGGIILSEKCNFHTSTRPHRKATDSQEIGQMLENSDK